MNLHWFSPLPPASTDVAHFTARTLPVLARWAKVTLWTDQVDYDPGITSLAQVRSYKYSDPPWPELNRGDIAVYNIGNNPRYHARIWEVSQRHPGVVILHDVHLHELFFGLYFARLRDFDAYVAQMTHFYGEEGRRDAIACYRSRGEKIYNMAERYPLTLLGVENALGVLVHTREASEIISRENRRSIVRSYLSVACAGLPFPAQRVLLRSETVRHSERGGLSPIRLIIFGYIGRNRRLDSLLEAIAGLPERASFRLDIYGEVSDKPKLLDRIKRCALQPQVAVHGFVPEEVLDAALAQADLAVNLRLPTGGEVSGSQLRIWAHSLPSLVTQTGWYATVPEDTVAFVRPSHEKEDIRKHLRMYLSSPSAFIEMGQRGREYVEKHHSPEAYASALMSLVEEARRMRSRPLLQQLQFRAEREISTWTRAHDSDEMRAEDARRQLEFGQSRHRSMKALVMNARLAGPLLRAKLGKTKRALAKRLKSNG